MPAQTSNNPKRLLFVCYSFAPAGARKHYEVNSASPKLGWRTLKTAEE